MYKHLMNRLEEAHLAPQIDDLVFIPAEALRGGYPSDAFEDFLDNEPETILETLHWKNTDEIREEIVFHGNEKTLAFFMATHQRAGFLAACSFMEPRNLHFDATGRVSSWQSGCVYYLRWIYANTIDELVENIIKEDETLFCNAVKKAKTKK